MTSKRDRDSRFDRLDRLQYVCGWSNRSAANVFALLLWAREAMSRFLPIRSRAICPNLFQSPLKQRPTICARSSLNAMLICRGSWSAKPGLVEVATHPQADCVVSATVGAVGFVPTLRALEAGKRVALANKETLVMAGELMTRAARAVRRGVVAGRLRTQRVASVSARANIITKFGGLF